MAATDTAERVHLQIVLPGGQATDKDAIRVVGKTRDHEKCVFESEGFVFKRARRTPPRDAAAADDAAPRAAAAAGSSPYAGVTAAGSGLQQALDAAAGDAAAAAAPAPQPAPLGPLRVSMAASELAYLVQWVLAAELRLGCPQEEATGDGAVAARIEAAAQAAADRVGAALTAAQSRGEGGDADAAAAAAEPATVELAPAMVLPWQVARLKAQLAEKRDWLLRVEQAWGEVEEHYNRGAGSGGGDSGNADSAAAAGEAEEEAEAEAAGTGTASGPAAAARGAALAAMDVAAADLDALASKVELAAGEAEALAAALQASFHAARFSLYPHVNSPAVLVKSLMMARGGGGGGGPAAPPPVAAAGGGGGGDA